MSNSTIEYPVAVLSFNRPEYLEPVLRSLANQRPALDPARVTLFQDGYRSKNGNDLTDPQLIERCVAIFEDVFPRSKVITSDTNQGVAFSFDRAERYVFEELGSAAAFFFEDDLILSPNYCAALTHLTELAKREKRIAYVAAYGDHRASLAEQQRAPNRLIPMAHKWGFALTRRQWEAQHELIIPYLEIVGRADYRARDHAAIREYFRKLGYGSPGTSQDAMKDVASCVLGTTKVMTFACFGKYIGEVGTHSTKQAYDRYGFGNTELYPDGLSTLNPPTDTQLDQWIEDGRAAGIRSLKDASPQPAVVLDSDAKKNPQSSPEEQLVYALYRVLLLREPDPNGLRSALRLLREGRSYDDLTRTFLRSNEFREKHRSVIEQYVPEARRIEQGSLNQQDINPASATSGSPAEQGGRHAAAKSPMSEPQGHRDGPDAPKLRMSPGEIEVFTELLNAASNYLEWGAGGSTLAAVKSKVAQIVSVETDRGWVDKLKQQPIIAAAINANRLHFRHIDIGTVGAWGAPTDEKRIRHWPRYALEPFVSTDLDFDLILVDGRFRLHCLLAAAQCAGPHTLIFLHDYALRHSYTIADKYFDTVRRVDSGVVLKRKRDLNHRALYIDLVDSLFQA